MGGSYLATGSPGKLVRAAPRAARPPTDDAKVGPGTPRQRSPVSPQDAGDPAPADHDIRAFLFHAPSGPRRQ